ncbi:uncharacterized protein LOC120123919 [Hibiscus syriacus]|uniref:uncharacterized protein LOC120123919 n=1 Tax=Hibiscus syriacus TaxID=106335 RepID=UPI001923EF50|nr:uncharacterized protein LOC120123919 [Hibiscus syriacus]
MSRALLFKLDYQAWWVSVSAPYDSRNRILDVASDNTFSLNYPVMCSGILKGDEQQSACEVTLVHYEDMGIPKDVAKLGVRHGMWGAVKKLHSGMRAYQNAGKTDASLSRCALMARTGTKNYCDVKISSPGPVSREDENDQTTVIGRRNGNGLNWKLISVAGTVALAFRLRSGVIVKALLVGAGQRNGRR